MPVAQTVPEKSTVAKPTRRAFLLTGGAAAMGLGLYAGTYGRHQLEGVHRTFALRNLPDAFAGMRFVQISDLHLEEYAEPSYL